jgi:hypothetical protein
MKSVHYSCRILRELEFSQQIFEKYTNIKRHENLSGESRVVTCGRTDGRTDRQTSMTQLQVIFSNFSKAPETVSRERE